MTDLPPRTPARAKRRRRIKVFPFLLILLMVMPLAEIAVILAVGRTIGGWPTFALLLAESLFGAWLMKREGRSTWGKLSEALRTGRMPGKELTDSALVLVGGALLLAPGFITDAIGFFAVAPPTRPIARRILQGTVERRLFVSDPSTDRRQGPGSSVGEDGPDVVQGKVL
ncbi:FxsA family protein [Austwickia chelonae]|uniref:FxsA family protein n=1 Tax=Austwickia chelonae TaxID=100225 RepID=UPI001F087467|nr:FxsA family protein [Austwickia chelonae]